NALALSPDGNQVLSGGADKVVRLSNFANGQPVRQLPGPTAAVRAVAYAPNGATAAAGTADHRLYLSSAGDGKPTGHARAPARAVPAVAFHPQSTQLLTAGDDGLIKVWTPPAAPRSLTHPDAVLAAALTADGKRLITGGADKTVRVWNLANNQMDRQFSGHTA